MPVSLSPRQKHFGAIHALDDVSLDSRAGEVVGLMGDNGAGKSTLVKIVAGNYPAQRRGKIFDRRKATAEFHRPVEARNSGIEIVYQDLALCDNLPAAVNVFLGRELTRGIGPLRCSTSRAMNAARRRAVHGTEVGDAAARPRAQHVGRPASGGRDRPHAALAIRRSCSMDEPTAAISVRQVAEVLNLIRELRDQGIAVVLISHRMPDVFAVADRIVVLRRGAKVADKRDRRDQSPRK